jgi:hypothetical protein
MEWNGMTFNFLRWWTHFNIVVQGAEQMLSHAIKVQFPNLNFQFCNVEDLTLLVGIIGDILEVEKPNSYIKRPIEPMVTIEMFDIT